MSEREEQRFSSPLESERGSTTIQDSVVSTIAGLAAREIEGVDMGGGASRAAGGVLERVTGSQVLSRGISVEVGKIETAIEVTIAIEYGRNILQLAERVRNKITERVESLTGLRVVELNVTVGDIVFPEEEEGRLGEQGSSPRQARQTEEFGAGEEGGRERAWEPREKEHVRVESTPPREKPAELELGEETQERPPTGE